jgi:O-antigen ligase
MNRTNHVFQKPHNMYLQIGIQYGVLALIAFMFILGLYYKETFKEIIDKNNYSKINIAIAFSLLSYLLAGLFNDTVIINSIYFWIMLALAYSKIDR